MKRLFVLPTGPVVAARLLPLASLLFPLTAAFSQSPAPVGTPPVLPSGPLLEPVANNTRWTLTTTSKAASTAKPEGKPRRGKNTGLVKGSKPDQTPTAAGTMVGEEMGKTAHILSVAANGAKREKWTDGSLTAILNPGARELFFTTGSVEDMPAPTWISRTNFVETKTEAGKTYFVFHDRIVPKGTEIVHNLGEAAESSDDNLEVEVTATVDADTHLPVTVTEGSVTTTYKFEPLAPDAEIIPASIRSALQERKQDVQDATRKPARP